MHKLLNLIIVEGVKKMFEVIEKLAGGTEPAEGDPSVTPDVDNTLDLAAIVRRIERLEQTVAGLIGTPEETKEPEEPEETKEEREE